MLGLSGLEIVMFLWKDQYTDRSYTYIHRYGYVLCIHTMHKIAYNAMNAHTQIHTPSNPNAYTHSPFPLAYKHLHSILPPIYTLPFTLSLRPHTHMRICTAGQGRINIRRRWDLLTSANPYAHLQQTRWML